MQITFACNGERQTLISFLCELSISPRQRNAWADLGDLLKQLLVRLLRIWR